MSQTILQEEEEKKKEQQKEQHRQDPLRTEDIRLLKGVGTFVADYKLENQVYMGLVKSPLAHAKIVRIDLSKVINSPDYIDSLTGEDLLKLGVQPVTQNQWPPQKRANRYHLAVGKVRFAGEPVAAIVAKSKSALDDLLELVEVEYERLPAITTIDESKQVKTLVYEEWKDNISQTNQEKYGDADKAISSSAFVIQAREGIRRQHGVPIEPHAVLVSYDMETDRYNVFSTVQSTHGLRNLLSMELRLPKQKFHVKVFDMGGGFGTKGGPSYPWPLLACIFAKKTGLPIKWVATRTEEFLEAAAGRDEYCDITLACDEEGKITALKARIECDVGVTGTQAHMPAMTMWTMTGPYNIPNVDLAVTAYATNKMPIGPVRGAGAPEGCYFIERAIEILSRKVGLDPIEFRRRNVVGPRRAKGEDYQALLDWTSKAYDELLEWKQKAVSSNRHESTSIVAGVGVSLRGESEDDEYGKNGSNEHASISEDWNPDPNEQLSFMTETARVILRKDGATVYTGSSPHGQGHETVFAQLASSALGIPFEKVHVIWGDTDLIEQGVGTFGSRSATTGGSAVVEAARKAKSELLRRASKVLGAALRMNDGVIVVGDTLNGGEKFSLEEIFTKIGTDEISSGSKFTLKSMSESSASHVCGVLLDTETGKVTVKRYTVTEDCGIIINKPIVEGQIQGGVVHGIGGALFESLSFDEEGNLLASSFMDYTIPSAAETPDIEINHIETPSSLTPHGAKGVGESGTIASYAAVMNALNDALSQSQSKGARVDIAPALPHDIYKSTFSH